LWRRRRFRDKIGAIMNRPLLLPSNAIPGMPRPLTVALALALFTFLSGAARLSAQVKVIQGADAVHIQIDGQPFTDFVFQGGDAMKPYLYPLRSASGKIVTRRFPMESLLGEPTDHPHQRGSWFGHEKVNGIDFWNNEATYKTPNRGRIVLDKVEEAQSGPDAGTLKVLLDWFDPQGKRLLEESRAMVFRKQPKLRIIDFDITLKSVDKVVLGDAKDGAFGIRLAAVLQESAAGGHGGDNALPHTGRITNAEGLEHEKAVWGKLSDWVDYSGVVDGEKVGVTIFDHPANTRRARWHVRGYGLFAANPFGLSVFTGDKTQDGSLTLEPSQSARFRYRVIIHSGETQAAEIGKLWNDYLSQVK
jgi:Methane oxygenase PmoA